MKPVTLIAFDLDGTLALSKSKLSESMGRLLSELLKIVQVCVISGGTFKQFEDNLFPALPSDADLERLHILPTSGTRYYRFQDRSWRQVYSQDLTYDEKHLVAQTIKTQAQILGYWEHETFGERIEDRGSQITFSALGQLAPVETKLLWDPDNSKKDQLRTAIAQELPEFRVASGGSTSIDVTKVGVDKAYGIQELAWRTQMDIEQFIFIGDRLDPGGNDASVLKLGIRTYQVDGPAQTELFIQGFLEGECAQRS
jgi:HAD superfamily hydrolase (TIGR01484 family)